MDDLSGLSDKAIKEDLFQRALQVYDSQVSKLRDEEAVKEFQKVLILRVVDNKWTDHIDALDQLRNAVGLRGYAQNNPVVEYQAEGFRMFNDMIGSIEFDVTRLMMKHKFMNKKDHKQNTISVQQRLAISLPTKQICLKIWIWARLDGMNFAHVVLVRSLKTVTVKDNKMR